MLRMESSSPPIFQLTRMQKSRFLCSFSRRLVVCAASLLARRCLLYVPYLHSYPSNRNFGCCNEVTPEPKQNINIGKHAHAHVD